MRILIADDHALMLKGIRTLLEKQYEIVGTASDGRQLVEAALTLRPDLIILDVGMPQLHGFEAAKRIRASLPSTKLIFLSMHSSPMYLRKALEAGASAYVLKTGAVEELGSAIRNVMNGESYFSSGLGSRLDLLTNSGKSSGRAGELTDRQMEILQLIAEGQPSKEIAHILNISTKTVDFHRARIMARMGVRSVAELVRAAVEEGFIPGSDHGILKQPAANNDGGKIPPASSGKTSQEDGSGPVPFVA